MTQLQIMASVDERLEKEEEHIGATEQENKQAIESLDKEIGCLQSEIENLAKKLSAKKKSSVWQESQTSDSIDEASQLLSDRMINLDKEEARLNKEIYALMKSNNEFEEREFLKKGGIQQQND